MNIKKLLLLFFAAFLIYSCQDEFIDDPAPSDGISEALVFSNRSMVDSFLAGMGRRLRRQFTTVDSNGINAMYYARTVKGNDVIQKRMIEWIDFCLIARQNNEDIYELAPYLKEYNNAKS